MGCYAHCLLYYLPPSFLPYGCVPYCCHTALLHWDHRVLTTPPPYICLPSVLLCILRCLAGTIVYSRYTSPPLPVSYILLCCPALLLLSCTHNLPHPSLSSVRDLMPMRLMTQALGSRQDNSPAYGGGMGYHMGWPIPSSPSRLLHGDEIPTTCTMVQMDGPTCSFRARFVIQAYSR